MNAKTTRTFFSRTTEVEIDIRSKPKVVWDLLTDAKKFPEWNSTVLSIEGEIAKGKKIKLKSTLDAKRTFQLTVRTLDPERTLEWGDAMGRRVFELSEKAPGTVHFSMRERIGGPLFPLFAGMIPSFDESFNRFARDLKNKAESVS